VEAFCPCSVASCQGRHRLVLAPSERQDPSVPDSKNRTDPPVLALAGLGPLGKLGRPHTGRTPRCVRTAADHALAVAVAAESEVCADGVVASDSAVVVICAAESAADDLINADGVVASDSAVVVICAADDLINAAAVAAEAAVGIVAVVAEYAAVEAVAVVEAVAAAEGGSAAVAFAVAAAVYD